MQTHFEEEFSSHKLYQQQPNGTSIILRFVVFRLLTNPGIKIDYIEIQGRCGQVFFAGVFVKTVRQTILPKLSSLYTIKPSLQTIEKEK